MIKGVFNSIILVGRLAHRITANLGRQLLVKFNKVAKDVSTHIEAAVSTVRDTLRGRFNNCNDNLGFSGTSDDETKAARVQALIGMLQEFAHRVAEGTAMAVDALGIVCELEALGIHVTGLPLYAPGASVDHTKTVRAPTPGADFYRRPAPAYAM